ncbi:MAG: diaminopimelate decarboxylase [Chloroflexi bacterium]|nr:diaminopimelate decarboxylase [Chloroflexota bacterium]MCC6895592.1 diaminopimelate decarboxylase [Anaerolineae bacterium]
MLNDSIHYVQSELYCDDVPVSAIAADIGTPVYIYSLKRILDNLQRIRTAFADVNPHIHYSAKANANLTILRTLINAGAGIDAVSAGEIHKALLVGTKPEDIVFAGVGKTRNEIRYALEQNVGWFNVENALELQHINDLTAELKREPARVALRLNPDITAATHRYIATGHKAAKFGLSIQTVKDLLKKRSQFPHVKLEGIHIHIGSQLHNTAATRRAVEVALECLAPYPEIRTVNIGGGMAVRYSTDEDIPKWEDFGAAISPLLKNYHVILEPGRSLVADAGILAISVLYFKEQGGEPILITDGSMAELIRPALYEAHHEIVPVTKSPSPDTDLNFHVVGPVCESADALGHNISLARMEPGSLLAVLTAGAYGMVMSSNYNQRLRPPEVVVETDGKSWRLARRRETWEDLTATEIF